MKKTVVLIACISLFYIISIGCSTNKAPSIPDNTNTDSTKVEDSITVDEIEGPYKPQEDYSNVSITVSTNKKSAVYQTGEMVVFKAKVLSFVTPVTGYIQYTLSNDGVGILKQGIIKLKEGEVKVQWTQNDPMVIRCTMMYLNKANKEFKGTAAAAVSPLNIPSTTTTPTDFVEYWESQIDLLTDVSPNPQMTRMTDITNVEVYNITLDNVGDTKVHGYFGKPNGNGTYPAILYIPGAGVSSADVGIARNYAAKGFLTFSSTVHDMPNGETKEFYTNLENGLLKDYYLQGRRDRDTYYYHRVILGCIQALNFLTSLPEWDHKHLIVFGSSQGGGLSLITTGLDNRVTAASANVPALNEHGGRAFDRPAGWPQLVPRKGDKNLDQNILEVSRYYDAVNFAKRIVVPVIVGVGLIDNVCTPTTVFSAYNELKGKKEIDIAPLMGHSMSSEYAQLEKDFINKQGGK